MAREHRKLAAIIAADVVGYSRLMGRDESGTLARLRKNRSEHLDRVLTKYAGRLVKLMGDGALVEFGSAVDALSAASEFQQGMAEANRDQSADTALVHRMGLHLGDLIVDGDDLYGDGVNIAARLEAEAPAGGIVISRTAHEAVTGRVKATFEDLGSLALKNIERPVQAFSVKWQPSDWQQVEVTSQPATAPSVTAPQATPLPLSIVVLPFVNVGSDPQLDATMAERNTELAQVAVGQLRQRLGADVVLLERLSVTLHAEANQPHADVQAVASSRPVDPGILSLVIRSQTASSNGFRAGGRCVVRLAGMTLGIEAIRVEAQPSYRITGMSFSALVLSVAPSRMAG